tara:strand:+ start:138 stop:860 length:723 start_codon:yes stop_codon:yes gene_type:complete
MATAFNEVKTIETMIALDKAHGTAKHKEMAKLAAEFGDAALMPTKMGGLSRNSFKDGATMETMQKAAISAGLILEKAQCLSRIIGAINAARPTAWQNYQECYFGTDVVRPTVKKATQDKTPEQKQFTEAQELKAKLTAEKKDLTEKAKLAGAQALILGAKGKTEDAKKALEVEKALKAKAKNVGDAAKSCADRMAQIKTEHKDAILYEAMQLVVEKLKVRFGAKECFDMTIEEILTALAN